MFVSIEGCDGSGKSTAVRLVGEQLQAMGYNVTTTRTPGGTLLGCHLRQLLVGDSFDIPQRARPLLFMADMEAVVKEVIMPALDRGEIAIIDRYFDSTVVYQILCGAWSESEQNQLIALGRSMLPMPDLTVVLDISPARSRERLEQRGDVLTYYDLASETEAARRRREYLDLWKRFPERNIQYVDTGDKPPELVAEAICMMITLVSANKAFTAIAANSGYEPHYEPYEGDGEID